MAESDLLEDVSPEAALLSPCQMGVTGHCKHGRHNQCSHRPGGPCANGIRLNETYVTLGGVVVAEVVEPHHIYRCPCKCHHGGIATQLDLFGGLL